jgi:hypothetical protein
MADTDPNNYAYIPVPPEMKHFDWQKYRRDGIEDILSLNDYVSLIVDKIEGRNTGEDRTGGDDMVIRELIQFSNYLLEIIKSATWKDVEAFEVMKRKIKTMEISLGIRKREAQQKKKEISSKEKDDVAKIAALMK